MQNIPELKGLNDIILCFAKEKLNDKFSECKRSLEKSSEYDLNIDTVLLDSFHSATIEGARTTIESVKRSLADPKSKGDRMVINNMNALNKIYSGYCINDGNIRGLWNIVVDGVCENKGVMGVKYRSGEVYISSLDRVVHTPAAHSEIEYYMSQLFSFMENEAFDSLYKAIIVHFYFVYIHPFCDGNGRLARILQNYCLYTGGYEGVRKIRISQAINMHLGAYYKVLESVETPVVYEDQIMLDLTAFIEYMFDRITEACHLSEKKQYDLSSLEVKILARMSKRGIGAEITAEKAAAIMNISLDESEKILDELAERQYLFISSAKDEDKKRYKLLVLIS